MENEVGEQLAFADRVIMNKIDLVTKGDTVHVEGPIRSISKFTPIQHCQRSDVSVGIVLNIKRVRFVYQGVYMIFTGEFGSAWDHGEERVSKMVFIGKNLDHELCCIHLRILIQTKSRESSFPGQ